jgi:glycosyltransferase involved in cell wall biosynthesis
MFCPQFRPHIGGAERQAERLAMELSGLGHRVTILTPRRDADSPEIEQLNGVTIERFALTDLSRLFPLPGVAVLNIPYMLWQIARAMQRRVKRADIIHCHIASLETGCAALAGRMGKVHVVCKAATAAYRSDLGEIRKKGLTGRLVEWLVRASVQTWVATTASVEEALVRAGIDAARIVRIPNGIEVTNQTSAVWPPRAIRSFLYVGRVSRNTQRDFPTMIEAFDCIAAIYPDIQLAVVGDGDLWEKTRKLAEGCAARDRILLPGFDQPEKWLSWADCLILPSRQEGMSNALLEAMAAGVPCIANDIPSNREVLDNGNAGVLVPVEDRDALVAAMRDMAENGAKARRMAQIARERAVRCYSIEAVADRYVRLYQTLAPPHRVCPR